MRARLKELLKPVHDRIFDRWIYTVPSGRLAGVRRRGRPPWMLGGRYADRLDRELAFLEGLSLEGKVAFDVGGNLGAHSLLLQRLVGSNGQLHVFEPDPFYRRELLDLVVLNDFSNFEVHGVGLGETAGPETLIVPDPSIRMAGTVSTELKASLDPSKARRRVPVRITTLDGYRRSTGLPPPDFIKIDVEGFEREVIRGGASTIREGRPVIMVEIHGLGEDAKRAALLEIVERLSPSSYAFEHLETGARWGDAAPKTIPVGGHLIARPT